MPGPGLTEKTLCPESERITSQGFAAWKALDPGGDGFLVEKGWGKSPTKIMGITIGITMENHGKTPKMDVCSLVIERYFRAGMMELDGTSPLLKGKSSMIGNVA